MAKNEADEQDIAQPDTLDYEAWGLLANVSEGDWTKQTPEWP